MISNKHSIARFINYYFRSSTIYNIHSPYLYELLTFTTDESRLYYDFQILDDLRRRMLLDTTPIQSLFPPNQKQSVQDGSEVKHLAQSKLSSLKKYEWLFRLILFLKPQAVVECTSSLGLSSLYIARALEQGKLYVLESEPLIVQHTLKSLRPSVVSNIEVVHITESNQAPNASKLQWPDFLKLNGEYLESLTHSFAKNILLQHKPDTIFMDNIYRSKQTTLAWEELKNHDHYNVILDFYNHGLLLNRPEISGKIEISYIDYYKKFWQMGFFK